MSAAVTISLNDNDEDNRLNTAAATRQQVRRVLVITLVLNVVVALSKIIIGIWSGALSITADGFHSLVDGSSNIIALVANRIAAQPPDSDHPYGHRRFETIAALGIGAFLLLTAWEIITSALERLTAASEPPVFTPLSFAVMLGTLVVNIGVNRYEAREGVRLNSELLSADAAHTGTDILVTLSVLASMVLITALGWVWLDTVAALLIVGLILRVAWGVLRRAGGVLVDTAPYQDAELARWVEELPSVERVMRARSRGPLDAAHIDIDIQVPPETTADHAETIAEAIRAKLTQRLQGIAEIEVHFVPDLQRPQDYALRARACADALGLSTHEVRVNEGPHGKVLEMHVEVAPGQSLAYAHERVSQLEANVQHALPDVAEVITHIEPALPDLPIPDAPDQQAAALKQRAGDLLRVHYPDADWHRLRVYPTESGFTMTMHVALLPHILVEDAHRIAESAEMLLRAEIPALERVTIHTEPPEA